MLAPIMASAVTMPMYCWMGRPSIVGVVVSNINFVLRKIGKLRMQYETIAWNRSGDFV
jgi:hypothetical protein